MQSGRANTDRWMLIHEAEEPLSVEPLMGYTASGDMKRQIKLSFPSREAAVAYAERNGIPYEVYEDHDAETRPAAYADNFRPDRPFPWTH